MPSNTPYPLANPNKYGEGLSPLAADHPMTKVAVEFGYEYSHSTNIPGFDGSWRLYHTFKHASHSVNFYADDAKYAATTCGERTRRHIVRSITSLSKHLRQKTIPYPELRSKTRRLPSLAKRLEALKEQLKDLGVEPPAQIIPKEKSRPVTREQHIRLKRNAELRGYAREFWSVQSPSKCQWSERNDIRFILSRYGEPNKANNPESLLHVRACARRFIAAHKFPENLTPIVESATHEWQPRETPLNRHILDAFAKHTISMMEICNSTGLDIFDVKILPDTGKSVPPPMPNIRLPSVEQLDLFAQAPAAVSKLEAKLDGLIAGKAMTSPSI